MAALLICFLLIWSAATFYILTLVAIFAGQFDVMKDLKDKYKKDFEILRTSINEFDPCGLIAVGAPVDEYDYLTNKVLGLRHRGESRDKIRETVLHELTDYFGEDIESFEEPYKTDFYKALDKFLDETQRAE